MLRFCVTFTRVPAIMPSEEHINPSLKLVASSHCATVNCQEMGVRVSVEIIVVAVGVGIGIRIGVNVIVGVQHHDELLWLMGHQFA